MAIYEAHLVGVFSNKRYDHFVESFEDHLKGERWVRRRNASRRRKSLTRWELFPHETPLDPPAVLIQPRPAQADDLPDLTPLLEVLRLQRLSA